MSYELPRKVIAAKKRSKLKGRKTGESFVALFHRVLNSEEFGTLTAYGSKLFLEFGRQYRGNNNGDFSAAFTPLSKRGWNSPATLNRAKKELVEKGFAIVTRQGGRNRCSLYALTIWPIDDCKGKHDEPPSRVALDLWQKKASSHVY